MSIDTFIPMGDTPTGMIEHLNFSRKYAPSWPGASHRNWLGTLIIAQKFW